MERLSSSLLVEDKKNKKCNNRLKIDTLHFLLSYQQFAAQVAGGVSLMMTQPRALPLAT